MNAPDRILIADDDPDIARFIEVNLELDGFEVFVAHDGERALELAREVQPALILLDVMMPKMDGVQVCKQIRADRATAHINVIMLTAKSLGADKIAGLTAGADDYIIKPFDPLELVARVRSTLRRSGELRAQSPLTGLPGNVSFEVELAKRLDAGLNTALCYADIDNFKSFNDHYGFQRGDSVIVYAANLITGICAELDAEAFVAHIGGDDFLILIRPDLARDLCTRIIERFDADVHRLYDPEDGERGYIEVENRRREMIRFPLLSISIGVALSVSPDDPRRLAEVASEMKAFATRQEGSVYAVDRRAPGGRDRRPGEA